MVHGELKPLRCFQLWHHTWLSGLIPPSQELWSGLSYEVCRYLHHSIDLYNNLVDPPDSLLILLTTAVSHLLRSSCQTKLRIVSSRNFLITPLQSTELIYYPFHHPMPQLGYQLFHPLAWAFTWSLLNFRWQ